MKTFHQFGHIEWSRTMDKKSLGSTIGTSMKNFLGRSWQDLKQKKNLDLYLVLAGILLVFVADIVGINTTEALVNITLAVLALLLYGMIESRHINEDNTQRFAEIGESIKGMSSFSQEFLSNKWPSSVREEMEMSSELWLIGVSLVTTVKTNYSLLESKLKQGHTVKVLLIHPGGVGVEIAVSRNYSLRDVEQKCSDIRRTLKYLCDLQGVRLGHLEIRTTQHPLAYGAIVINPQSFADGRIYIENYGYRVKSEGFPIFSLSPAQGEWYEFYRQELALLWDDSIEWECKNTL